MDQVIWDDNEDFGVIMTNNWTKKWKKSLALTVALYTAMVIAAAMAVYAVFQYIFAPGHTVVGLILEHMWHVVVLGTLVYLILYWVLYRKVVQPINALCLKFYAISTGNFNQITLKTNVAEIQEIVEGVNLMLARICKSVSQTSLSGLSTDAQKLRSLAKQSGLGQRTREELIEIASTIDQIAMALSKGPYEKEEILI